MVSICDADGIKKPEINVQRSVTRQTEALRRNSTLDVVIMFIRLRMELTSSVMLASPWMVCLMALLATAKLIIIHQERTVNDGADVSAVVVPVICHQFPAASASCWLTRSPLMP